MQSHRAPSVASEYEHLNLRNSCGQKSSDYEIEDSDDEDFISFKPQKLTSSYQINDFNYSAARNGNVNNSCASAFKPHDTYYGLKTDEGHIQAQGSVPVPFPWNPLQKLHAGPSVFVTPEKSVRTTKSIAASGENAYILEPQDINKIPLPTSWSPSITKPSPSIFITPEKTLKKVVVGDNFLDNLSELKENIEELSSEKTAKGKCTVRFDLPSASSGDETVDTTNDFISDAESPITLKGSEVMADSVADIIRSPIWKSFSPQKSYCPSSYSDESVLDDSVLNIKDKASTHLSQSIDFFPKDQGPVSNVNLKAGLDEHLTSTQSTNETTAKLEIPANQSQSARKGPSLSVSSKNRKASKSSVTQPGMKNIDSSQSRISSLSQTKDSTTKAGPQYLKSPPSQFDVEKPRPVVIRESKNNFVSMDYSFPFNSEARGNNSEMEHVFARPEFNSTLKVRSELNALSEQKVDVNTAVKQALAKSELKTAELNEKAALHTNCSSDQFHDLVDLDTSVEGLCQRVLRMRTSRVPGKKVSVSSSKKSSQSQKTPDLMEFFSSDLQKENPDLSLPGIVPVTSDLLVSPHVLAFDLYRHNRAWQGPHDL